MQIITSSPLVAPPPEVDLNLVRGDIATIVIGFTDRPDVVANPAAFRVRLAFRRRQSDTLPDLTSSIASLELSPPDTFNGIPVDVVATMVLTPLQTSALPAAGCFYYIEWTDAIGGSNRRILQGRALLGD